MWRAIRHHVSVAVCSGRLSLQRQLEYPAALTGWLVGIVIQYLTGVWMLKVLVDRFQPLAGWTFPQLAFLYGLALLSHGLQVVFFIQTWWIGPQIVYGRFDQMILRPMGVFFQFMAQRINLIGCLDLIPGTIIFLYGCHAVGFAWTAGNAVKLFLVLFGAMLIRAGTYTIVNSIAFWTMSSGSLQAAVQQLFHRGSMVPLSVYPQVVQMVLTFLVPVGFVSFYPACEFVGQDARTTLPLDLALWTPLVGILVMTAALAVFRRGLRRYESAGS